MRAFLPIDFEFSSDLSVKKLHKIFNKMLSINQHPFLRMTI